MDWWTSLAACIALLWIFCFIDGNAVLELRLLFPCSDQSCLSPVPGAAPAAQSRHPFHRLCEPLAKKGMLHFLEGMCVVCETVPNLMGAALSVGAAFCHMMQGAFYVLAATLRTIQINLFSQMNGERERWDRERHRAKESEKKLNSKVLEYISVFCQDPVSALRIKVDVPPVYR
ncbi:hypothetical protein Q5P01_005068 [Channa striata]|uniref:Uncharacterized protein n=1 Tax=Channa striata TaxID=64152 RepID=A0AA88NBV6_CHASR|nr:hypothetical protein Q5P01_005068 [Channa striata]